MVGKERLADIILILLATAILLPAYSCDNICMEEAEIEISLDTAGTYTKAALPEEDRINDISLVIFDSKGKLEYSTWSESRTYRINLLKGETYTVCACINFGYRVNEDNLEKLYDTYYHMAYPDEYREGIPMFAMKEICVGDEGKIILEPERLMSKICIRIDRSKLSEGVRMDVTSVRIGNCPKKVRLGRCSRTESEDDSFKIGFSHSGTECEILNKENSVRMSGEISLFMLENMHGRFSDLDISTETEKVFKEYDIRNALCSYVEIELDYTSEEWCSSAEPLKYRFYIGEDISSFDIERNCLYRITICPEDEGLNGDGWRVDKSGLTYTGQTSFVQYPESYIRGDIGDQIHIGCMFTPLFAPFDVGEEYMKADNAEGIYDYQIDPDGKGATLTLTGPGRGLIYMEAGEPVNDAALFIIEVNKP